MEEPSGERELGYYWLGVSGFRGLGVSGSLLGFGV